MGFPRWHWSGEESARSGDIRNVGLVLGSVIFLKKKMAGFTLLFSLGNPMDRRVWRAAVHKLQSQVPLSYRHTVSLRQCHHYLAFHDPWFLTSSYIQTVGFLFQTLQVCFGKWIFKQSIGLIISADIVIRQVGLLLWSIFWWSLSFKLRMEDWECATGWEQLTNTAGSVPYPDEAEAVGVNLAIAWILWDGSLVVGNWALYSVVKGCGQIPSLIEQQDETVGLHSICSGTRIREGVHWIPGSEWGAGLLCRWGKPWAVEAAQLPPGNQGCWSQFSCALVSFLIKAAGNL